MSRVSVTVDGLNHDNSWNYHAANEMLNIAKPPLIAQVPLLRRAFPSPVRTVTHTAQSTIIYRAVIAMQSLSLCDGMHRCGVLSVT